MIWLGIDPGASGGIALLKLGSIEAAPLPIIGGEMDVRELRRWIVERVPLTSITGVAIEKSQSLWKGQSISASFKYGKGYGMLVGAISVLEVPVALVGPRTWKAKVLHGTKKDKDAAILYVHNSYPSVNLLLTSRHRKPHDGMADAVCIATWCRYHSQFRELFG